MWVDDSGYFYNEDLPFNRKVEPLKCEYAEETKCSSSENILFLNTGGTIVSGPDYLAVQGVVPYKNISARVPCIKGWAYKDLICKLSEKWTVQDFLYLKEEVARLSKKYKKIVLTCGTDNVSFIAPFVSLLCLYYNFKAIVLISQKSLDKPTTELSTLLKSANHIFKKLKIKNCVVCATQIDRIRFHNPFQIKKTHTTKRNGFYSKKETFFTGVKIEDFSKSIPKFQFKEPKKPQIYVETPLKKPTHSKDFQVVLARGTGNLGSALNSNHICTTIVGNGPTNTKMYNSQFTRTYKIQFSWEALVVISAFTTIKLEDLLV